MPDTLPTRYCMFCMEAFANDTAYQIHLGIGAPAFHACNTPDEMTAKGMIQNKVGVWSIAEHLVIHQQGWAYLKDKVS